MKTRSLEVRELSRTIQRLLTVVKCYHVPQTESVMSGGAVSCLSLDTQPQILEDHVNSGVTNTLDEPSCKDFLWFRLGRCCELTLSTTCAIATRWAATLPKTSSVSEISVTSPALDAVIQNTPTSIDGCSRSCAAAISVVQRCIQAGPECPPI